ncbi:hypothetical protein PoB_001194900 [Plakobranchus ocellatus]|uniref:Secreted protein n=1 Tax=Plakobranchus ocellatus TaxID=259542 RepID=A0AAV3YTS2_9GAST|nr:hypothetical protein PoB_001194900 [Plakobranchus ocellatus]
MNSLRASQICLFIFGTWGLSSELLELIAGVAGRRCKFCQALHGTSGNLCRAAAITALGATAAADDDDGEDDDDDDDFVAKMF